MNIKEPNYWYGYDNFKKNIPIELGSVENYRELIKLAHN